MMELTAEDIMTFPNHGQVYPGQPYPYRELPPEIPKRHTFWIAMLLFGTIALVLAALVIGFWRAADAPMPTIDVPTVDAPPIPPGPPVPK
jgi:hypothetical protein